MVKRIAVALFAGALFGAGLVLSGMADPLRVHGFLDLGGAWDPTLAFVMAGALLPMTLSWHWRRRREKPFAADAFHEPPTHPITLSLLTGAALFGIGWGLSGLCPGPALADLALAPLSVWPFVLAMLLGFGLSQVRTAAKPEAR